MDYKEMRNYISTNQSPILIDYFKKPLISIYTPTYNRNKLLRERAIPSVLNQTYKNWEWIIVHEGYHDKDLGRIIQSYDDKRIRYYNIARHLPPHNYDNELQWLLGGTYPANYALDRVNGEWIARLDDDDIWSKDHLEKSFKFIIKENLDFITSQFIILKGNKGIYKDCSKHEIIDKIDKIGCHSSWFYSSKIQLRYDPECYKKEWNRVNDADFLERMFQKGFRYGFLEETLTCIKVRPNEKEVGLKAVRVKNEI
jgi:glycosyltransferase involved in cell wall biosynthesis